MDANNNFMDANMVNPLKEKLGNIVKNSSTKHMLMIKPLHISNRNNLLKLPFRPSQLYQNKLYLPS